MGDAVKVDTPVNRVYHVANAKLVVKRVRDVLWDDIKRRAKRGPGGGVAGALTDIGLETGINPQSLHGIVFQKTNANGEPEKVVYPSVFILYILAKHYGKTVEEFMQYIPRATEGSTSGVQSEP